MKLFLMTLAVISVISAAFFLTGCSTVTTKVTTTDLSRDGTMITELPVKYFTSFANGSNRLFEDFEVSDVMAAASDSNVSMPPFLTLAPTNPFFATAVSVPCPHITQVFRPACLSQIQETIIGSDSVPMVTVGDGPFTGRKQNCQSVSPMVPTINHDLNVTIRSLPPSLGSGETRVPCLPVAHGREVTYRAVIPSEVTRQRVIRKSFADKFKRRLATTKGRRYKVLSGFHRSIMRIVRVFRPPNTAGHPTTLQNPGLGSTPSIVLMVSKPNAVSLGIVVVASWLSGCATVTTRVTSPDGTVTETVTRGPDAAAMEAITATAIVLAPRGIMIREEKSSADMEKLLKGWQGRKELAITKEEISNRWKP